jgi:hypothetical protein
MIPRDIDGSEITHGCNVTVADDESPYVGMVGKVEECRDCNGRYRVRARLHLGMCYRDDAMCFRVTP